MTPGAVVRAAGLSRRFGDLLAVDGLSFAVEEGELFGLVGPDGAGKSTTLRMLAGVLPPTGGDATVLGHSIRSDPEGAKPEIAYMSQRFGLYEDLTVLENLRFYADLFEVPESELSRRLERLFAFSNLEPFQDRLAGKLSGGMKQKLGLSCALIHQPRLLLLDEPTFGVDPVSRRELWVILHQMVAEGVTAVVSTAYMDEAERFDRVALLHGGRLLALDPPRSLQEGLAGRVVELATGEPRRAREAARRLPQVEEANAFGERLHLVVSRGVSLEDLQRSLGEAGLTEVGLRPIPPSLEDVFIQAVAAADREAAAPGEGR